MADSVQVSVVSFVLAIVSLTLIVVSFTDLGDAKTYSFVVGEVCAVTAVAFGYSAATARKRVLTLATAAMWLGAASFYFATAAL